MDPSTLVESQIDDGRALLAALNRENVPVRAAGWLKPVDEERWSLYIATPLVDEKGPLGAYREVYRVLRTLGPLWLSSSDVKLIGERHPITAGLFDLFQRHPGVAPLRPRHPLPTGLPAEDAYVYPPALLRRAEAAEPRRLKTDVLQVSRPEDFLLSEREKAMRDQIIASGVSPEDADRWVRKQHPQPPARPPIPAGTVVNAWVAAYWGDRPEDDPDPTLLVEAADGARGLVARSQTEPAT
jgi:hypothetical protein